MFDDLVMTWSVALPGCAERRRFPSESDKENGDRVLTKHGSLGFLCMRCIGQKARRRSRIGLVAGLWGRRNDLAPVADMEVQQILISEPLNHQDTIMNSSIGGPSPTNLSARLGILAGTLSTARSSSPVPTPPPAYSPGLMALLDSLHRRHQAREHLKALHFIRAG